MRRRRRVTPDGRCRARAIWPGGWLFLLASTAGRSGIPGFAPENSAAANGLALAEEADRRGQGYGDSQSSMTMTLFDGRGASVTRAMRSKTLEGLAAEADGERTLLVFDRPRDVRGTAFLTHSHRERDDDQWLYLPSLKRVKRITSRNRAGSFMSSEFSYEDLGNDEVAKYDYRYLGQDLLDGEQTYTLERTPKRDSGYSRHVVWLATDTLNVRKVDYYDRGDRLLKTLRASGYQQYLGRYWRPDTMHMMNHQTGRSTTLSWQNYTFGAGLAADEFERSALRDTR
ncbi:MAG: outer membrane lipoprotein-sorting protein [Pseudomonadota bacterium]